MNILECVGAGDSFFGDSTRLQQGYGRRPDGRPAAFVQVRFVTRAAKNLVTNRFIELICPFLPSRVFAKFLPISRMIGRGGGDRIFGKSHKSR